MSLKVGIVGAAGYAGAELIRLMLGHPEFELVAITSNADAGQPLSAVYPSFAGVSDLVFTTHDAPELKSSGTWGPAHQMMSLPSALKRLLNGTANSHSGDFWRLNSFS